MGLQVVILSTLNGIAIGCDTTHNQTGENNSNIFRLNDRVAIAVHDSLEVGGRFVTRLRETTLPENLGDILARALELFNAFVAEPENRDQHLGIIFTGYGLQGKPIITGTRYDGPQTPLPFRLKRWHPYVVSSIVSPLYPYLHDRMFTPDMPIEEALDLVAFLITQSRIILRRFPFEDCICLAKILPDQGFSWISDEEIKNIVKRNHKRSLKMRKECAGMFLEEEIT